MPKITIRINNDDYSDFLAECNMENMTPEEKMREIITCYVILRRNRRKLPQKILDSFLSRNRCVVDSKISESE
ncbi:MAG TPA: hypothetical protein VJ771_03500 [Candidatus Nitrosotalea sp.]|nr:hypothetical protein [Candidatus Nitrosotalea sp.]